VLFGSRGVLINNMAYLLRHVPVFGIGGMGGYRVRAIHVDDLADLAVRAGAETSDRQVIDAVGPERPTFLDLVRQIRRVVGSHTVLVPLPGPILLGVSALLGMALHDTLLTGEEYHAMRYGLADTDGPATGPTRLSEWLAVNADTLGRSYANEVELHFR
jgi:NADH dehydrogenase